jgi:hypothetical protein
VDDNEFLESLKTNEERFEDQVQSAEHFIRLKKQSGYGQSSETTEKTASAMESARRALSKSPTLRAAVLSGVASGTVGAGLGAASSPPGHRLEGAVGSGIRSGAVGAAGGALYQHLSNKLAEKRASMADKLKSIGPLAGTLMAGGAAAGGIGTYLASKPQDHLGGKSRAEDELEGQVKAHQERPETGLLHKMKNRTTELEHGYAKAFRDHPGKAALIGAGAGAAGGYGLAKLLDAVRKVNR